MNIVLWGCLFGLLLVQLMVCLLAWRHLARRLHEVAEARQGTTVAAPSESALLAAVARIEAQLQQMGSARTPPAPQAQAGDRAYELAQRMARDGADAARITEACGIARHEAELLCRLHAPAR